MTAILALCAGGCLSIFVVDALAATPHRGTGVNSATTVTTAPPTTAPGLKLVTSPKSCPSGDRAASIATGKTQARGNTLAPATGEKSILLCRYNGMKNPAPINDPVAKAFGLVGHHNVTSTKTVAAFVRALNNVAAVKKGAVYSCPMDVGADIIAYFRMGNGHAYRYTIDTGGCNSIVSGKVNRLGLGAAFIGHMERLAPRAKFGTVVGNLVVCRVLDKSCGKQQAKSEICDPLCGGQELITLRTSSGKTVATVKVNSKDRFTAHVSAGRYRVAAINVPGKGVQPMTATSRSGLWVTVRDGKRSRVTVYVARAGTKLEKA